MNRHLLAPDERLYFLHIPKAAGSTLTYWLRSHFAADDICTPRVWPDIIHLSPDELARFRLFTGHFAYSLRNVFKTPPVIITMLREPLARTLSYYEFVRRREPHYPYRRLHEQQLSLVDYLRDSELRKTVCNDSVRMLVEDYPYELIQRLRVHRDLHDSTPVDSILDRIPPDEALDIAKERLTSLAAFGLTEQFQESLNVFAYVFGWSPSRETQILNEGAVDNDPSRLTPLEREAIEETNQLDIALYAYAKTLFEQRYAQLIYQLLEDDHRRIETHAAHRLVTRFELPMDTALSGSGWQAFDPANPEMRWTGPETISTLNLPLKRDQPLKLSFRIVNVLAQDILDSFHVEVNGHPAALVAEPHPSGAGVVLNLIMTPEILNSAYPTTQISFHVNRTVRPRDIDPASADERALGVALAEVRVEPVA